MSVNHSELFSGSQMGFEIPHLWQVSQVKQMLPTWGPHIKGLEDMGRKPVCPANPEKLSIRSWYISHKAEVTHRFETGIK